MKTLDGATVGGWRVNILSDATPPCGSSQCGSTLVGRMKKKAGHYEWAHIRPGQEDDTALAPLSVGVMDRAHPGRGHVKHHPHTRVFKDQ